MLNAQTMKEREAILAKRKEILMKLTHLQNEDHTQPNVSNMVTLRVHTVDNLIEAHSNKQEKSN